MDKELDRILADDYLAGLGDHSTIELRALRDECQIVETQLSYLRRLVQGRHDIVSGEISRRRGGGAPADVSELIDRLPEILSDRIHAPGPSRMPTAMEPGVLTGRLVARLDDLAAAVEPDSPGEVSDEALATVASDLAELELEVSQLRRSLFDRIDALQAELTRRYRDGETSVDDLLAGDS